MANVEEVEVVVVPNERATLRVGDVFLKIDADQARTDVEVEAMARAPLPTPEILWRKPPVLALASPAAWAAAGAASRTLHDAPLPPWPGRSIDELASRLDGKCEWLVANGVLPADLVTRNQRILTCGHRIRAGHSARSLRSASAIVGGRTVGARRHPRVVDVFMLRCHPLL
jgi:hypothetical protein